jgi:hypothetical protein
MFTFTAAESACTAIPSYCASYLDEEEDDVKRMA